MTVGFPAGLPMREIINVPWSMWGVGGTVLGWSTGTALASATWPAADRSILCPVTVTDTITVRKLWVKNGTAVAGNLDLGIYDATATTLIASTGEVLQAGTSAIQSQSITATVLAPGSYYMALASDSGSSTFMRAAPGASAQRIKHFGLLQASTNSPLASSPTLAILANDYVPMMGWSTRSDLP